MRKFRYLLYTVILLQLILCCDFAPGSYPYAELYKINSTENELIELIRKYKLDNPQYNVPPQVNLIDGRTNKQDPWCHVYFFYKDKNEIVNAWVRDQGKGKVVFALHAINKGLTLGNWKRINKDFGYSENSDAKAEFENRVLNKILNYRQELILEH